MAILLRSVGVPTRNVTGFVGGTYNRFGHFYAVRQGDAHSWVEVYLDGTGWVPFDPTPAAAAVPQVETSGVIALLRDIAEAAAQRWSRYVVGYDLEQQLRLLRWLAYRYGEGATPHPGWPTARSPRRAVVGAAGLALLGGAAGYWYWLRRRRRAAGPAGESPESLSTAQIVALYRTLDAAMAARGAPRFPSTPPLAHAQALEALGHPMAREVLSLTQHYLEVRYAGRPLTETDRRDFARRVRELRQGNADTPAAAA
jgi:hypothetical protein